MADYIKREDAIEEKRKNFDQSKTGKSILTSTLIGAAFLQARSILQNISAADVRENVHGEWVERKDVYPHKPDGEITSWGYKCSRCNQLSQLKYNFCFNCGADMRGENDV